jgi:hypothetical protein
VPCLRRHRDDSDSAAVRAWTRARRRPVDFQLRGAVHDARSLTHLEEVGPVSERSIDVGRRSRSSRLSRTRRPNESVGARRSSNGLLAKLGAGLGCQPLRDRPSIEHVDDRRQTRASPTAERAASGGFRQLTSHLRAGAHEAANPPQPCESGLRKPENKRPAKRRQICAVWFSRPLHSTALPPFPASHEG